MDRTVTASVVTDNPSVPQTQTMSIRPHKKLAGVSVNAGDDLFGKLATSLSFMRVV